MLMSQKPENIINKIKEALKSKGYTEEIPKGIWINEFMIQTGYSHKKIKYWTKNFIDMNLIFYNDDKINFKEK